MDLPRLTEQDLARLADLLPQLDFSDAESRLVLIESGTRDTQAAPGSGKTTLVAAKLILLAEKWRFPSRGICVLSHTNVARDEVVNRLSSTASGPALLSYPHYIGTIHSFVNQYVALPMLRSVGLRVDVIDDAVFARRALRLAQRKPNLRGWLSRNQHQGEKAISSLRFAGPDMGVAWDEGNLPGDQTPSGREAREIKEELRDAGVFRHADMFAFAERVLQHTPAFPGRLAHRFPLVLLDEMQDTSWEQESLLSRLFGDASVLQRFGDRNQRILGTTTNSHLLTFPKDGHLSVSTSRRFSSSIASVVRSLQEHGELVRASGRQGPHPTLILYESSDAGSVVEVFGRLVLQRFTDEELLSGTIRAIGARKESGSKQAAGRCLLDYFPAFGEERRSAGAVSLRAMLAGDANKDRPEAFSDRVRCAKQAILRLLREAKAPVAREVRDPRWLLWVVEREHPVDGQELRRLCHWLCTSGRECAEAAEWDNTVERVFRVVQPLLPVGLGLESFRKLHAVQGDLDETGGAAIQASNVLLVRDGERSVSVDVGTVASAKGETHLATLVLECVDKSGKGFDLGSILERIAVEATVVESSVTETKRIVLRNMYVATSRPRHFLCLAMNRARATDQQVETLRSRGWEIVMAATKGRDL